MTLRALAVMTAVTLAFTLTAIRPAPVFAATTVTVTTTLDETQAGNATCSLREATLYANGAAEPDCAATPASGLTTITVPAGVYVLTGGALSLTGNVAIAGAGATTTTITAAAASQVFVGVATARAAISDVAVTGGNTGSVCGGGMCGLGQPLFGIPGGGIANAGALSLTRVIVTGNTTGAGGINPQCTVANPAGGCSGGNGGNGGGISNTGTLTITNSTITGNSTGAGAAGAAGPPNQSPGNSGSGGSGGGISNSGTLTISNSTIAGNTTGAGPDGIRGADASPRGGNASAGGAGGSGAGIESSGPLVISGTTLVGNRPGAGGQGAAGGNGSGAGADGGNGSAGGAGGSGGAIDSTTDMTITNSTIVANSAAAGGAAGTNGTPSGPGAGPGPGQPGIGGGIDQRAMGTTLTHVTVTANSAAGAGGGVDGAGGTVTVANSIIAGNVAAPPNLNCAGVLVDQGGNVEFAAASCPAGFAHADPKLTGLADNGGPTQTIALQPGSAAIQHVRTCVLRADQRGVSRPVGSPCDSGAYQVAPPSVSGVSAGTITTASAVIAAAVNPNLQDTTVVVNYGLTPSYGSTTPPQDLGAGNAPGSFTAALTGLQPNKTYHFDVVATNADGQTTTSDGVFTTLPPLTASIASASTLGPALRLTIACGGGSGPGTCNGAIQLTARVPGKRHRTVRLATRSYSVNTGGRTTVRIVLNRTGQTMLAQHYTLSATLSLGGTTRLSRSVSFKYRRIKADVPFTLSFFPTSSVATELGVTGIPRGGRLTVSCRGGGCPFARRSFAARHGHVELTPIFKHASLRAGTTLEFEVTASNRVGYVETLVIRSGEKPTVTKLCLPPGTSRPARCV